MVMKSTDINATALIGRDRVDSLHVRFKARTRPDLSSSHMWGQIVDLETIERAP